MVEFVLLVMLQGPLMDCSRASNSMLHLLKAYLDISTKFRRFIAAT
jgi:hypothetical protein